MKETEKLCYEFSRDTLFCATVLSCGEINNGYDIVLDKTYFYPEGGGQPHDTGSIGGARVVDVRERGGIVYHTVDKPFVSGEPVACEIDWERRFGFMQQHTGEHIVSGILLKMYGLSNVGFHIGAEFTTIDTDKQLPDGAMDIVEARSNQAVYENLPVETIFPTPYALSQMRFRSKLSDESLQSGGVRVVEIPGVDTCACCGLHCAQTGEVGLIKLIASQPYKGGTRIYMLFGAKAVLDYNAKNKAAYAISAMLSSKPGETAQAVEALKSENAALRASLAEFKNLVYAGIAATIASGTAFFVKFMDGLSPDDLRRFALLAGERAETAIIFSADESGGHKYALNNKNENARNLSAEMNASLNGRGGGSAVLAQGTVKASREDIESYLRGVYSAKIS
ncbi:MAG: alanine--tRNA ligase-related protein [Defluviitaleaceae bacterium]|nr:alanine--tRNA ligase-related protein [Defluviitaleaceae bacterium]MCL2836801.1 alanine--tRNA ligase-related protein [Defluviitaleaceae bacterium]